MKMKRQREYHHHRSLPQSSSFSSKREKFDQPERMGGATKKPTSIDALGYLKVMKTIFHNEIEKYEDFILLMKDFKAQRIDTIGVREKIKELFEGHHELIVGFNAFLPKEYKIAYLEDEQSQQKKQVDFVKAYKFVSKLKVKGAAVYQPILRVLYAYRRENKSVMDVYLEVAMLLQDQDDLLEEFNYFLPDSSSRSSINCAINMDMPINSSTLHMDGGTKSLHGNMDASVECTNHAIDDFNRENKEELDVRIQEESDGYCKNDGYGDVNLTHDAHNWHSPKREAFSNGSMDDGVENIMHQLSFTNDGGHAMGEHLVSYRALPISMEVDYNDRDHDPGCDEVEENGSPEMDEHSQRIAITNIDNEEHEGSSSKNKFIGKAISELDWSNCKRCTPSYRLLPANYPLPSVSHWTVLGSEVLNDRWASVTSGSEDYTFKHTQKNQYEDAIFQCEDDRVEMDLLIESVKATIKHIGEFLDKANSVVTVDAPICLDDHFSTLNFRCIERLYGDHGLDVVNLLRKKPFITLPIILTRLNQKQEEWITCHAEFKKVWDEIYFKNYKKSLDHNSFCLMQQDMKSMRKKALLTEIRGITEKNSKENDKIYTFSGKKCSLTSNMEFEYLDSDIHEDLYQLIMYSSRELCATEQFTGVMNIWMTFLEPMLNVTSRLEDPKEPEGMNEKRKTADMSFAGGLTALPTIRETDELLKNGEGGIESDLATLKSELELGSNNKSYFLIERTGISYPCTSNMGVINKGNMYHKQIYGPAIRLKIRRVASLKDVCNAKDCNALSRQCHPTRQRVEIVSQEPWREKDAIAEAEVNVSRCQLEEAEDEMDCCNDIKGTILPFVDHAGLRVKPTSVYHPQKFYSQHKTSRVFYGNDSFYILFRLHQILYERIRLAKIKASSSEVNWRAPNATTPGNSYSRFKIALYNLIDGTYDNAKFEDECRTIMGTQSYMLFTLDKLIRKLIKQLLVVATNKMELQLLDLHVNENSRKSDNLADNDASSYHLNAQFLLGNQNMYLIKSE